MQHSARRVQHIDRFQDIVSCWPHLSCDLEEIILSARYREHLLDRLSLFERYIRNDSKARLTGQAVLEFLSKSTAPFWSGRCLPSSFQALPTLTREITAASMTPFLEKGSTLLWFKKTSGTTGQAVTYFYGPDFIFEQHFLTVPKALIFAGLGKKVDVLKQPLICFHISDTPSVVAKILVSPFNKDHLYLRLRLDDPHLADLVENLRPSVLTSRPELLELLCDRFDPAVRIETVISSGSALSAQRRALISKRFKARVLDIYSSSEFPASAFQCPYGRQHFDATSVLMEVLDEDGITLPPGHRGELTLSAIVNKAQALTRFRTGDRIREDEKLCLCGKRSFTLLNGRYVDRPRD